MEVYDQNVSPLRLQGEPRASAKPEGLSDEVLHRFELSPWLGKVRDACHDAGLDHEGRFDTLTLLIGERLQKLRSLAEAMCDEADAEDLRSHLVFAFVEAKTEWYQLNTIINYGVMRGNAPEPETIARAVLISMIVAELDEFFGLESIEALTDLLHDPLPNAHTLWQSRNVPVAA